MNRFTLVSILAALMLSSALFAHDPAKTKYPLTFYYDKNHKQSFCIIYAFSKQTLKDLYEENPLNLPKWEGYCGVLKHRLAPPTSRGYVTQTLDIWKNNYAEIGEIWFWREDVRKQFFQKLNNWLTKFQFAPFVDDRTDLGILTPNDEIAQGLIEHMLKYQLPVSLLPPKAPRILSCGDDISRIDCQTKDEEEPQCHKEARLRSAAYRLANFYTNYYEQLGELIIAGDILIQQAHEITHDGQRILGLHLDNLLPFGDQLEGHGYPDIKFQVVLGWRLLCCCNAELPNLCCGGFDLAAENHQIFQFLMNVTGVLDETSDSIACLTGYNAIEPYGITQAISAFNQTVQLFEAKIIRRNSGEFYGIVIRKRQAAAPNEEKQADDRCKSLPL